MNGSGLFQSFKGIHDDQFLKDFFAIAVSPQLKKSMKLKWGLFFGYNGKCLFPELEGFSNYHSATSEISWDFYRTYQ